jgi:hypothetical protein
MKEFIEIDVKGDGHCGIRAFYLALTGDFEWKSRKLGTILKVRTYIAHRGFKKLQNHPILMHNTSLRNEFRLLKNSNRWLTSEAIFVLALKHKVNVTMFYAEGKKIIHDNGGILLSPRYPTIYMINYNNAHYRALFEFNRRCFPS